MIERRVRVILGAFVWSGCAAAASAAEDWAMLRLDGAKLPACLTQAR